MQINQNNSTYFRPSAIMPYKTPVVNINPLPNMLLIDGHKIIAGIANLQYNTNSHIRII